jgi:uncharacterized protein
MIEDENFRRIVQWFEGKGRTIVAFSGGLDSTLVAAAAKEALGDDALLVTVKDEFMGERALEEAISTARLLDAKHRVVRVDLPEEVLENKPERCYLCKKCVLQRLLQLKNELGFDTIVDGTNSDDLETDRPGLKALKEFGTRSPLAELGIRKNEVMRLNMALGLDYEKPSMPCYATRFPFGHKITPEEVRMVEEAERIIREKGLRLVRVRVHGKLARIEVGRGEMGSFLDEPFRSSITAELKKLGFVYVTLDLEGYRAGSMASANGQQRST